MRGAVDSVASAAAVSATATVSVVVRWLFNSLITAWLLEF